MTTFFEIAVWESTYEMTLTRLIILQKRIIRIITKSSFDTHTTRLFHNNNLLYLKYIHAQIYTLIQLGSLMLQSSLFINGEPI